MRNRLNGVLIACLLTLFFAASVAAQADDGTPKKRKFYHNGDIETSFDKEKNETKVELKRMNLRVSNFPGEPVLQITAYYTYPGTTPSKPQDIVIGFISQSAKKERKFQDFRELKAKFDGGETLSLGTAELVDTRSLTYSLKEVLGLYVPYDKFLKVANVEKDTFRMSIGNINFELDKKHLEAFRDLLSRTNP